MEIKKEILPSSKVKLNIKVSSPEMRSFFARIYNKLASQVEVKGFRTGTAPKSMTIAAIGENRLNSEIIDLALRETYLEALKKEKLLPISHPRINIKMLKDLTADTAELEYSAEIDLMPKLEIGNYKKIKIKKQDRAPIKVAQDEIDQVISHLARSKAQFKDITRPVKEGDRVEINFDGFDKHVKLENLSSKNYPVILGSKVLIGDFEKHLIGLRKQDKKEFTIDIPEPGSKAAKKRVDFKIEVLQTQEVILPKIDDNFAQKFKLKNLAELKKSIQEDILKQKKLQIQKNIENQILEELLKITKIEIPESLIEQEIERQIAEIKQRAESMNLSFEKYLANIKKTLEEFKASLRPQAQKTIKIGLALGEIVKREEINPKDKEAAKAALEKLIEYATRKV